MTTAELLTLTNNITPCSSVPHMTEEELKAMDIEEKKSLVSVSQTSFSSRSVPDGPTVTPIRVASVASMVCRICQTNTAQETLISPCNCKGTLAYVHLSCLERWLNQSSRSYCELCMFQFNAIQTQRYKLWEGLRLWVRHPRNRTHFQSDILISVLLTVVTVGLIVVCLLGMQYFVIEGRKIGISRAWTRGAISMFLAVILIGYTITIYLLIKDQIIPWYNWWKHTVDVRLTLPNSTCMLHSRLNPV